MLNERLAGVQMKASLANVAIMNIQNVRQVSGDFTPVDVVNVWSLVISIMIAESNVTIAKLSG